MLTDDKQKNIIDNIRRCNMSFINKKELAEILHISVVTIDRLRKKGLPCHKIGSKVVFDYEEVEKWIKK